MTKRGFVTIGEVGKPHGLKGEVYVRLYGDSPFLLDECQIHLEAPGPARQGAPKAVGVRAWREHNDRLLVQFKGSNSRNQAEELRGSLLKVRPEDMPQSEDGELFLWELEGLEVVTEDGAVLGVIEDILTPGGTEIWALRAADGREVLLPAHEETVLEVDLEAGRAVVAPPEGLLELYAPKAPEAEEPGGAEAAEEA